MSNNAAWLIAWLSWGALFIALEVTAILTKSGGTLSETVWRIFGIREKFKWHIRFVGLALFMTWLTFHFLFRI